VRNQQKWSAAVARLASLVADLSQAPNESHIFQYHDIVRIFEDACGQDLAQFRIAPDRVNSRDNRTRGHWQTPFAAGTLVEHSYFCRQVRGLAGYVKTTLK
jgi:hypothetical protein